MPALSINIDRLWQDIETLATFSARGEGVNRWTFSEEDCAACAYLRAQMTTVGLAVWPTPRTRGRADVGHRAPHQVHQKEHPHR